MSNCKTNAKCATKICTVDSLPTFPEATTLYTLNGSPFTTFYRKKECGSGYDSFEIGSKECPAADCIVLSSDITIGGTTYVAGEINIQDIAVLLAAASHDEVTVTDGATIDFTLVGQALTGEIAGVSTSTPGQVPVADGAGGLTWTTLDLGTVSKVTDNGDGTYSHEDGLGNVITIDTNATSNFISSDITIAGTTYVAGTATVQEVLDALTANSCDDPKFTINAGTTAVATDNSLGEEAVNCGDIVHFWSSDGSIDFSVTAGSAIIDVIIKSVSSAIVTYDNTASGLTATDVQGAIDELAAASSDDQTATEVAVTPTGNLAANNVQDALVELQTDIDNIPPETVTNFGNTNAVLNYVNEDGTAQDVDLNFLRSPWDNADGTAANQSSTTINYPNKVSIGQSPTPVASLDIDTGDNTYINVKRNGVRIAYLGDTGTANAGILHLYNTTGIENARISGSTSSVNNASYVNRYSGDFGVGTNAPIEKLQVVGNVSANAYLITSDSRLKYDFVQDGTKVINGNTVALYRYKRTYDGKDEFGVIAQDVYTALDGKQQETKDLIIKKNVGVDHNATLEAINDKYGIKATNLLEAYELALDQVVKADLENNGFPTINRVDAIAEFTKLSEFEPTLNEDGTSSTLSEAELEKLENYKKVDFSGQTTYQTFNVNITDLHSINTTALSWLN